MNPEISSPRNGSYIFFHEKKLLSVRIDPATVGSEPILPEMRHFRKSRLETDIAKSCKIKFQWGVLGGFSTFEFRICFGPENPFFEQFGSLLPARTVTVKWIGLSKVEAYPVWIRLCELQFTSSLHRDILF